MQQAGIDTTKFKPHSTRAASTSTASRNAVPLENILTAAGWKRDCVFAKYYNKPVGRKSFSEGVLRQLKTLWLKCHVPPLAISCCYVDRLLSQI